MPTLGQLIHKVRHRLSGVGSYTRDSMELTVDLLEDGLIVRTDNVTGADAGVYEIGLEKIRVKSVDRSGNSMSVYTFGRGYEGTTPALHSAGSEVTRAGSFPASTVAEEINGVLREFFPYVYGVTSIDVEYTVPFTMPDDCAGIVAVFVSDLQATDGWRRVDRWLWEPDSGQGLKIFSAVEGEAVRISYAVEPIPFDLTVAEATEAEWSETGLPDRLTDLLTLGVASRLAPFADLGNLFNVGQEARSDQAKPPGRGVRLAVALTQEFQRALALEQQVLHKKHPIRVHRER
jgi:hypothetical protein